LLKPRHYWADSVLSVKFRPSHISRKPNDNVNLYIVGFMGTGKSTVARVLANRLGMSWLDSDLQIERDQGKPIPEIFASPGEAAFRKMELDFIESLLETLKSQLGFPDPLPYEGQQLEAWRSLLDYEIFFMKQGRGGLHLETGDVSLQEGHMVLLQPEQVHGWSFTNMQVPYVHFDLFSAAKKRPFQALLCICNAARWAS